jgi:hypothetical protein
MTLVNIPRTFVYPGLLHSSGAAAPNSGAGTTISAGTYIAYVFQARETMNISHVGLLVGTVTASGGLTVSINGVDASGIPEVAALNGGTATMNTGALTSNTFVLHALGASTGTIAAGTPICVKLAHQTGTSVVTRNWTGAAAITTSGTALPYQVVTDVQGVTSYRMVCFGSDATTFYNVPAFMPASSITMTSNAFNNTNAARKGVIFQLPFNARCAGLRVYTGASTGAFNVGIYDNAGAEVSTSSTAVDIDQIVEGDGFVADVYFDTKVELTRGTSYRAVIEPTSATNCNMYTAPVASTIYRAAWPGGTNWFLTTYVTDTWTDTATTSIPFIDLILDQVDDGTGTGSVSSAKVIGG